jgi:hypothetical protein
MPVALLAVTLAMLIVSATHVMFAARTDRDNPAQERH